MAASSTMPGASSLSAPISTSGDLDYRYPYNPPSWAEGYFSKLPTNGRLQLGNFPTPLYKLTPSSTTTRTKSKLPLVGDGVSLLQKLSDLGITLYVKRDDMSGGVETGGNKIRKLEFLLADAIASEYQSVVTIGGEQSNHCRATAAASRMLGLEPHIILRTRRADQVQQGEEDFGFVGNILFDRMIGTSVYTCTPGEYGRVGSVQLVSRLCNHLATNGQTGSPYPIPVGGSNGLGSWGYINGVDEMLMQWNSLESTPTLDHVVFASGSGGTAAGISIGVALAHGVLQIDGQGKETTRTPPKVHAVGVCDSPDYFYEFVAGLAEDMGLKLPADTTTESFIRNIMTVHQGKGQGYASSTSEELDFITNFAIETGIVLDPVYSGKALYHFMVNVLEKDPNQYRGSNILLWHTGESVITPHLYSLFAHLIPQNSLFPLHRSGGALGLFDKGEDLLATMNSVSPVKRLDVYGKDIEHGIDLSKPAA